MSRIRCENDNLSGEIFIYTPLIERLYLKNYYTHRGWEWEYQNYSNF